MGSAVALMIVTNVDRIACINKQMIMVQITTRINGEITRRICTKLVPSYISSFVYEIRRLSRTRLLTARHGTKRVTWSHVVSH